MKDQFTVAEVLTAFSITELARYKEPSLLPNTLKKICLGEIHSKYLVTITLRRYALAHFFVGMLERMQETIEKGKNRYSKIQGEQRENLLLAVTKNLDEELGKVEGYGGPHINGRKDFLKYFDHDYEDLYGKIGSFDCPIDTNLLSSRPAYVEFANSVNELFTVGGCHDHSVMAVAILWYYENRISLDGIHGDYPILLKALKKSFPILKKETYAEGDPLYHIWSHAQHDPCHAKYCEDALISLPNEYAKDVLHACSQMRFLFDNFWEEIYP